MSFCKIVIMGNLTANPDQRTTQSGQELTRFTIAVNTRNANKEDSVAFYRCTVWGRRGDVIAKYVSKGQPLLVSGSLTVSNYQAKDGTTRQGLDVNVDDFSFVGSRREQSGANEASGSNSSDTVPADNIVDTAPAEDIDEPIDLSDIPF